MRRAGKAGLDVAALELQRIDDQPAAGGARRVHVGDVRQVAVFDLRETAGAPRRLARLADDGEQRLAPEFDARHRKDRLVVPVHRRDVVLAGDIGMGEDADDAGRPAHGLEVDGDDLGMGALAQREIGMGVPRGSTMSSIYSARPATS